LSAFFDLVAQGPVVSRVKLIAEFAARFAVDRRSPPP
jgi:hypothetical protein